MDVRGQLRPSWLLGGVATFVTAAARQSVCLSDVSSGAPNTLRLRGGHTFSSGGLSVYVPRGLKPSLVRGSTSSLRSIRCPGIIAHNVPPLSQSSDRGCDPEKNGYI